MTSGGSDASSRASPALDPAAMRPYDNALRAGEEHTPITRAFLCLTGFEQLAVTSDACKGAALPGSSLPPESQWRYSLSQLSLQVFRAESPIGTARLPTRAVFLDVAGGAGIVLDIFSVRRVPEEVVRCKAVGIGEKTVAATKGRGVPLLEVRWEHGEHVTEAYVKSDATLRNRCWHQPYDSAAPAVVLNNSTAAEIAVAVEELKRNGAMLSDDYVACFIKQKRDHKGKFLPSFVVPRVGSDTKLWSRAPSVEKRCSWRDCAKTGGGKDAKLKSCDVCRSAHYCSRECQVADWKRGEHKAVCRRPVTALDTGEGADGTTALWTFVRDKSTGRESVVVPAQNDSDDGDSAANINLKTGEVYTKKNRSKMPPNVHGDQLFVVKVQVPVMGPSSQIMVYDEKRSFQTVVRGEKGDLPRLAKQIKAVGYLGSKVYFDARREGPLLRIFTDKVREIMEW